MSKCLECGYYDKEKHYCPFYCQLIRETLNEAISFELEKIKAEITACTQQEEGEVPACINYGIKLSTEIVEKHISKLKGENNDENKTDN